MNSSSADVLIIGAGAAGLAAAQELCAAGLHVLVVEARDRLGGRILTHYAPEYPVELGAEFIHGKPPEIFDLVKRDYLPVAEITGEFWQHRNGRWIQSEELMSEMDDIFEKMPDKGPDQSFQQFLDGVHASQAGKEQAQDFVEGFHAADPRRVSVHWLAQGTAAEEEIDGDRDFRFAQGYDSLVRTIVQHLPQDFCEWQMKTEVKEIRWKPGAVSLRTSSGMELNGPRVLITVPLSIWKSGAVRFSPGLPEKQKALQMMEMGPVVRVSLCFREKFWEKREELKDLSFLFTDDQHFPTWWTSNPLPFPIFTGWTAGRYAKALGGNSHNQIVERALQSLAKIFQMSEDELRKLLENAFTHDWQADPFSCGAYSYGLVGGNGSQRTLAAPVANTLFFAGEATNFNGHNGTVHGAIASGHRAAKEILQLFR
jgi:monoamine oxidase